MIPLEDKLRAAIHATAEEIPADPPPLRLGSPALSPRRRPRSRPGRRGGNPWLAPLAAAVLVVAVVLGSLALTRSGSGTATPATPAARAGLPPYYVALITVTTKSGRYETQDTDAQVRSTATGAVLATVTGPAPWGFGGITAAADDRTFVLTASGGQLNAPLRLFVLRINLQAHGRRVSLQPASSIPAGEFEMQMALSPDGTSLAVASFSGPDMQLTVFNLATGTRRLWSFTMPTGTGGHDAFRVLAGLSWTADGQHVAIIGSGASAGSFAFRLLDTRIPGPDALAASKPIPLPVAPGQADSVVSAIITPDGRTAVFAAILTTHDGPKVESQQQILKVSVATGKVTTILSTPKSLDGNFPSVEKILYTNATGSVLVVSYFPGPGAEILHGDTRTSIP
jgi:hypothetical protein